jgi:seryl-tRNA synthetase
MHCPLYNIHRQQLVDSFNELNIEFTIQTILYGSEASDYNQNVNFLVQYIPLLSGANDLIII